MKIKEIADKLGLTAVTPVFDKDVSGVYISDMVSDVIANAKAGNILVTLQVHSNVVAAANLVDLCAVIITQGKKPPDDVVRMAAKAEITLLTTDMTRWQVATRLYEAGVR
jgi:predicted transcriptional regulator